MNQEQTDTLELVDVAGLLVKYWRKLALWTFLAAVAGAGISYQLPFTYQAQAQALLPRGRSPVGGVLGQAAGLSMLMGTGSDLLSGLSDKIHDRIVHSRTISDRLIAQFHLQQLYRSATPDAARATLEAKLKTESKDGVLLLSYVDSAPQRAADITNAAVDQLQVLYQQLQTSQARQRRLFLDERLKQCGLDLTAAEEEVRRLQRETGAIDPIEQGRVTLGILRELLSEHYRQSAELHLLEMTRQSQAPETILARARLKELDRQLRSLEGSPAATGTTAAGIPSTGVLPLSAVPQVKLILARAERRLAIQSALNTMLAQEREKARIDEADDVEKLPVLDRAVAPQTRHSPRRRLWLFGFALFGLMAGLLKCALAAWIGQLRGAPSTSPEARVLEDLGRLGRWLGP